MICFIGNKSFTLHAIDNVMQTLGDRAWNLLRPFERNRPATLAIVTLSISTLQSLFLGTLLEICRERLFSSVFKLVAAILEGFLVLSRSFWLAFGRRECQCSKLLGPNSVSKLQWDHLIFNGYMCWNQLHVSYEGISKGKPDKMTHFPTKMRLADR
jgi:hypothetical protein